MTRYATHSVFKRGAFLFQGKTTITNAEVGAGAIRTLTTSQLIRSKGYIGGDDSPTWVAIEVFDGEIPLRGWIWVPKLGNRGDGTWEEPSNVELTDLKNSEIDRLINEQGLRIIGIKKGIELERQLESKTFTDGFSKDDNAREGRDKSLEYFVSKGQEIQLKKISVVSG